MELCSSYHYFFCHWIKCDILILKKFLWKHINWTTQQGFYSRNELIWNKWLRKIIIGTNIESIDDIFTISIS